MRTYNPRDTFLALALLTVVSCTVNSEVVIERWADGTPKLAKNYYHKDQLHYQLISYNNDGNTVELTHFEGDTKNGWNVTYFESGNVKDSIFLENNTPISISKHFHKNGNLKADGSYQDGKRDGYWNFYDSLGVLHEMTYYHLGEQNGKTLIFNPEGWLTKEIDRYAEGVLKEVINYKDSLKHGDYKLYDLNGNFKLTGKFDRGKRKGTRWMTYHSSGEKFKEVEYTSEDEWNTLLINLWNLDGEQTVKNGNGYFRFNNYSDCDGKEIIDSQTTLYYSNGKQSNKKVVALQDCG